MYFYKVNKRQTTIAAELLERSDKRSIDEALAAAYPRTTYQIQRLRKAGFKQEENSEWCLYADKPGDSGNLCAVRDRDTNAMQTEESGVA